MHRYSNPDFARITQFGRLMENFHNIIHATPAPRTSDRKTRTESDLVARYNTVTRLPIQNSPGWIRTSDQSINSRSLYR
jgi:hypothetical protein